MVQPHALESVLEVALLPVERQNKLLQQNTNAI